MQFSIGRLCWLLGIFLTTISPAAGQAALGGDKEPLLQLDPGGPMAQVTAVCFSPDGNKLYAAGYDKVVRVWERRGQEQYRLIRELTYRVPIGPGINGAINALAISPDGQWLAVGGLGMIREGAGFREMGWIWPATSMSRDMWLDRGTIYLFHTQQNLVRPLRGHPGSVNALTFVAGQQKQLYLLSSAQERDAQLTTYTGAVRVWDVVTGKQLAERTDLPDPKNTRPGISGVANGPRPTDLQVALAWQDKQLRLWDLASNQLTAVPEGDFNNMVAHVGPDRLLTASFNLSNSAGQLLLWRRNAQGQPELEKFAQLESVPLQGNRFILTNPQALAVADDHAIMVARRVTFQGGRGPRRLVEHNYTLYLFDMRPQQFGTILRESLLWKGGDQLPTLAVSGDKKTLAVAGSPDHGIRIFSLPALVAGQVQPQQLASSGTQWRHIRFARHGQDKRPGLFLSTSQAPPGSNGTPPGELVFSFVDRQLITNLSGWEISQPVSADWRLESLLQGSGSTLQWTYNVRHQNNTLGTVRLKPGEVATAAVLLPTPASGNLKIPLVAVAYLTRDQQPLLSLFHGQTGDELRRLTAHVGPIRGLSFQGEGKFLASVGEDQTIAVWAIQDLEQIVGKFGQLAGVAVKVEGEQLSIGRLDNPKFVDLRSNDLIDGIVQNNQLQRLSSTRDFYDAMLLIPPGKTATLRVRQAGEQPRDVTLPVTQAVDERKPLFSLFITTGEKPEEREWIGWSPHGHYEARDQQAERLLVWHFNTGQPEKPATSAEAKDPTLRQQFLKPRLLEHLMATGNLTEALEKYRKPITAPNFSLVVEEAADQVQEQPGPVTVRQSKANVKVTIAEPALAELASVTWQLDQQPPQSVNLAKLTSPEFSLPLELSARQTHQLRVTATTKEQQAQATQRELSLRYVPPPPALETASPDQQTVREEEYSLAAMIRVATPNQPVQFAWQHEYKGKLSASGKRPVQAEERVAETLKLSYGANLIRLVAENAGATPETKTLETTSRLLIVTRIPKQNAPPPEIRLEVVQEGMGQTQPVSRDTVLNVRQPAVLLQGSVTAQNQEKLVRTELRQGEKPLLAVDVQKANLAIKQALKLQPGRNLLHLIVQSETSLETELPFIIEYQPPLPGLEITSPRPDDGLDTPQTKLTANLFWGNEPQACQAVLRVNDGPEVVTDLQPGQEKLDVPLTLQPAQNMVHLSLRNTWGRTFRLEPLCVYYQRPPRDLKVTMPTEQGQSPITLHAEVQSPTGLPIEARFITARINGEQIPPARISLRRLAGEKGMDTWFVRIDGVTLWAGDNNLFELQVRNKEASVKEPVRLKLSGPKAQGELPVVEFLQPGMDTRVAEPNLRVQFRVRSGTPLRRLLLQVGAERFEEKDLERVGENLFSRQVTLKPGENMLRVETANDAGPQQPTKLTVNYVALPARLLLTDPLPVAVNEEQIVLPQAAGGGVTLRGQVVWPVQPPPLPADARVKVYVNGFLQPPAQLNPTPDPRRFDFVTQAYLNQSQNRIEMELPGIAQEQQRRQVILVSCAKPEPIRTRLVVVSVGLDQTLPAEALMQRAVKLFQDRNHWPFVLAEPPLVLSGTRATNGNVLRALVTTKSKIQRSATTGSPRDIVVVYFAGHEVIDPQMGHFLLTASSRTDPRVDRSGISVQFLEELLDSTYGARMLLLDVLRPEAKESASRLSVLDRIASWSDASSIAVARATQSTGSPSTEEFRLLNVWNDALLKAERFRDVEEILRNRGRTQTNGSATLLQHLRPLAEVKLKGS
jgi:WD40 repeat protein